MAQIQEKPAAVDIETRRNFYHKFLSITTVFSAHVVVVVAIVIALISHGHHGT